jgi:hypothetical protein
MTTTKTIMLPAFTVRADQLIEGEFIVIPSWTPVTRPIITMVLSVEVVGDDAVITTTAGETTTSVGNPLTCLGRIVEMR